MQSVGADLPFGKRFSVGASFEQGHDAVVERHNLRPGQGSHEYEQARD
jgi:hypothetical protein